MEELYWITRLDYISNTFVGLTVISGLITAVFFIIYVVNLIVGECGYYESDRNESKNLSKATKPIFKYSLIAFLASLFPMILTPTSKEAMLIYGVGTTIEYIKNNDTAKQLPDKCIDALDAWVESLTEDADKNKNK